MTLKAADLQGLKVVELRERCKKHELETKGLKSVLVARLAAYYEEQASKEAPVTEEKEEVKEDDPSLDVHQGTVKSWTKRGYGFIAVDVDLPDAKPIEIFVHRKNICMAEGEDPCLRPGMRVQFREVEDTEKNNTHAEDVKCADGTPISWWKKCGDTDREVYDTVYTGIIGEFRRADQHGYMLPGETIITASGETVSLCTKLHVKTADISEGDHNQLRSGRKAKFKLYKDSKGFGATFVKLEPWTKAEKTNEEIDTEARYMGRVLMFKTNNFGFLAPDDDLSKFGIGTKLYFKASDIDTDESPASVTAGMRISFLLYKDNQGLGAKTIQMPSGTKVVVDEENRQKPYKEVMPREAFPDLKFEGKVKSYMWDRGFGYVKVEQTDDNKVPEEHAKDLRNGAVYFNWNDLISSDKIVGIAVDTAVKFNLYKDEKGLGAENISKPDGTPISGQTRPKGGGGGGWNNNNRRRWGGGWQSSGGWRNGGGWRRGNKRVRDWGNGGYMMPHWKRQRVGMGGGMFGVF